MMQSASKPKRGAKFYHTEKNIDVWLERIKSTNMYFVCDEPDRPAHPDHYFDADVSLLVPAQKQRNGLNSSPKKLSPEEVKFKLDLNVFFGHQILQIPPRCENCNQPFVGYTKEQLRGIIAHILPKSLKSGFPEVAIHPQNRLFLGTKCGCHNRWDNTDADVRVAMTCYPMAINRYQNFKNKIAPANISKAEKYLKIG